VLRTNAAITPAPIPILEIVIGITKGKTIAPAIGVKATKYLNILSKL
tara:strand:- start:218 stop:358 length:141 start_codon:yes stop_codon:yes gene_type:complete